ncbi:MAG: hypothetical protein R3B13_19410 [Polyangiaceae bacterium]
MCIAMEQGVDVDMGASGSAPVRGEASVGAREASGSAPVRSEASVAASVERGRVPAERPRSRVERGHVSMEQGVSLGALSDADLLDRTLVAAARANRAVVALLAHLAEVDARGVHRLCACSSLHTYCRYELGMPEDTAQRRALAARLVRRFPLLRGVARSWRERARHRGGALARNAAPRARAEEAQVRAGGKAAEGGCG